MEVVSPTGGAAVRKRKTGTVYAVEMLPAEFGDCLWTEYGEPGNIHRVLIDCGTVGSYAALRERILRVPEGERLFDLFVVTHIDVDHIGGALKLLEEAKDLRLRFDDVWFNGWAQLEEAADLLGPIQGEKLTERIVKLALPWNKKFNGTSVVVPQKGALPVKTLAGGMRLTLLSPTGHALADLKPVWDKAVRDAGLVPGAAARREKPESGADELGETLDIDALANSKFKSDSAEPNGSSIAFIAEFDGRAVLYGADAHAPVLVASLKRLNASEKVKLDAFKLAHHGSKHNTSRELIEAVECPRYLVSTNGKQFRHPDKETLARVVRSAKGNPELVFNYRTAFNSMWDGAKVRERYGYTTVYSQRRDGGIEIQLSL